MNSLCDAQKERGLGFLNHGDAGQGLLWLSRAWNLPHPTIDGDRMRCVSC